MFVTLSFITVLKNRKSDYRVTNSSISTKESLKMCIIFFQIYFLVVKFIFNIVSGI